MKTCTFTAHRPGKLYGYNIYTPKYYKLGRLIRKEGTYPNIKNILAIPFKNQPIKWHNKEDVDRYNYIKTLADEIIYVDTLEQYKIKGYQENIYYLDKMQMRNQFMVDNSKYLIAIWDGSKSGTYNCIKYCEKQGKEIIRINPKEI